MGDHTHEAGELMFSYRFMRMQMAGNRDGSDDISPEQIVTSAANRFANPPMQPPTLRVVPLEMTMDMHMFGAMYAPNDRITLMAMVNYLDNSMDHVTFAGPTGTTRLGNFTTSSSGLGDISLTALIRLPSFGSNQWHATAGLSLPTGDIEARDTVLTPMNTQPELRLPYPMQLGSGSVDPILGLTMTGHQDAWGWGGQWRSVLRIDDNDEDYRLGHEHRLTGWASYQWSPRTSVSLRLAYVDRGNIRGIDPQILAPVQTADPDRQAAQRIELGFGANVLLPGDKHRLALELVAPIQQDLDGPQLETDWMLTVGWQFTP